MNEQMTAAAAAAVEAEVRALLEAWGVTAPEFDDDAFCDGDNQFDRWSEG